MPRLRKIFRDAGFVEGKVRTIYVVRLGPFATEIKPIKGKINKRYGCWYVSAVISLERRDVYPTRKQAKEALKRELKSSIKYHAQQVAFMKAELEKLE